MVILPPLVVNYVLTSSLSLLRYFFPTYENDALLCGLSDSDSDSEGTAPRGGDVPVIAEDMANLRVLKQTSVLNQLLKNRGPHN